MSHASLETVVELSGIQRGLLAECLAAEGSAVYQVQSSFRLTGPLDVAAMTRAWQLLVARHQALRSSIFWEGLSTPVQAVHRSVTVPVQVVDGDETTLERIRATDRIEPFDLRRPPHLRVTLVRLGPQEHELIWTRHHLQVDGWSQALLLGELFRLYEAVRIVGSEGPLDDVALLGPRTELAPFLGWQRHQRATGPETASFWGPYLAGLSAAHGFPGRPSRRQAQRSAPLTPVVVERIAGLARRWQVTPAAIHEAAWALVLAASGAAAQDGDVVFGVALATRPPELPDADRMIGLHITTLPVRLRLSPGEPFAQIARAVHAHGRALLAWQHVSPAEVQAASPVRPPARLYDSIVVIGNYPADVTGGDARASLAVTGVVGEVQNSLPLTLRIMPGEPTVAAILHDTGAVSQTVAEQLLARYLTTLDEVADRPEGDVRALRATLASESDATAGLRTELAEAALSHPAVGQARAVSLGPGHVRLAVVPGGATGHRLLAAMHAAATCSLPLFRLPDGMVVAHEDATMTRALFHEVVVDEAYLTGGITLADGAVVLDVGANVGLFLVWAATRWRDLRVHGYEPVPATAERARWNAEIWAPGSTVTTAGLGAVPGRATFLHYPRMSGASGQHADPQRDAHGMLALALAQTSGGPTLASDAVYVRDQLADRWAATPVEAPVTTVSAELRRLGVDRVDLLKIDAEGSELEVLSGLAADDWPRIRQVVLEAHTPALARASAALLTEQGFVVSVATVGFHSGTDVTNVSAVRPQPLSGARPPRDLLAVSADALAAELRQRLGASVPGFAMEVAVLADLPRTSDGSIDDAALVALPGAAAGDSTSDDAGGPPASALEQVVAMVWSDLLPGEPPLDRTGSFFDLGGHSLMAIRATARLRSILALPIPLDALFEHPTVAGLAAELQRRAEGDADALEETAAIVLTVAGMSDSEVADALAASGEAGP